MNGQLLKSGSRFACGAGSSACSHQLERPRCSGAVLCSIKPPGEKSGREGEASSFLAEGGRASERLKALAGNTRAGEEQGRAGDHALNQSGNDAAGPQKHSSPRRSSISGVHPAVVDR